MGVPVELDKPLRRVMTEECRRELTYPADVPAAREPVRLSEVVPVVPWLCVP